jgi:hypothetical protein
MVERSLGARRYVTGSGRRPTRRGRESDRERLALGEDGVEVLSILNEINLETFARGPTTSRGVDRGGVIGSHHERLEQLGV